jgi:TQXA domain-containing protein/LPXTG-motif cell wall-anchored protein
MITAQRQRRRRRASTVVASLAVAAGLMAGLAGPAAAASVAQFIGPSDGENAIVHGSHGGDDGLEAGLFDLLIDGEVESQAYCIDINTQIDDGVGLDEIDWDTSGVANLEIVEAILRHYYPNGDGPEGHQITGDNAQKAAATQAAIWHYTDGYELAPDDNDPTVVANYDAILAIANELDGFGEPTVTLTITPPASTEGSVGDLVGPYVINTSATTVALTPSDGVTLHNEDGSPFTDEVVDGTQVWLMSDTEGGGTITATAAAEVGAGRVFYTQGQQRLVLASTVETDATDEARVTYKTPPPTTAPPTTEPEPTTSVPTTTETTVVTDTPTTAPTTAPSVPTGDSGGGLPVTGAQSLLLAAVALVLVVVGAGFGIVSRRKRLES